MSRELKKISAKDVRDSLSQVMNEVVFGHQHYVITRHEKDAVVLIPASEWHALQKFLERLEDEQDIKDADEAHLRYEKEGGISQDEIKAQLGL
jgi:prevent-host-death family protein